MAHVELFSSQVRFLRQYDPSWEIRNFGVSGATLLRKGDLPYVLQSAYNDARACNPDAVVNDGFRHHVRLIWDGSRRYLYVDGREVAADTRKLSGLKFSGARFHLGAGNALQPGTFWPGLLDDIRIYHRAVKP